MKERLSSPSSILCLDKNSNSSNFYDSLQLIQNHVNGGLSTDNQKPNRQSYASTLSVITNSYSSINNNRLQHSSLDEKGPAPTKPEDLPVLALPVLDFIEDAQPHVIIGCDRGARLFSLAVHAAWHQTRSGKPFPTLDGKLHFARVSKDEDFDTMQQRIDQIIDASRQHGQQRGHKIGDDEQLRVLFIDDFTTTGKTKKLSEKLMARHQAQTHFAVMCGPGADATGSLTQNRVVSWRDDPREIGVDYVTDYEPRSEGTAARATDVVAVRSLEAVGNRRAIHRAARQLSVGTQIQNGLLDSQFLLLK